MNRQRVGSVSRTRFGTPDTDALFEETEVVKSETAKPRPPCEPSMIPESPGWDPPIITLRVVGSSYVFKSVFDRLKVLLRFKGGFTTSNGATVRFRYFLSYFRVF